MGDLEHVDPWAVLADLQLVDHDPLEQLLQPTPFGLYLAARYGSTPPPGPRSHSIGSAGHLVRGALRVPRSRPPAP